MRCETHCPPPRGPSLLPVVAVLAGVAAAAAVLRFAESIAAVVLLAVYVPCAVCVGALVRVHWAFLVRVFARTPVPVRAQVRAAITTGQLAIEAPRARPAWDNEAAVTGGRRVAVRAGGGERGGVPGVPAREPGRVAVVAGVGDAGA